MPKNSVIFYHFIQILTFSGCSKICFEWVLDLLILLIFSPWFLLLSLALFVSDLCSATIPGCLFIFLALSYSFCCILSMFPFLPFKFSSHIYSSSFPLSYPLFLSFPLLCASLVSFLLHSRVTMLQHLAYHDILTSVTRFIYSFLCVVACSPMKTEECAMIFLCSCVWVLTYSVYWVQLLVWSQH